MKNHLLYWKDWKGSLSDYMQFQKYNHKERRELGACSCNLTIFKREGSKCNIVTGEIVQQVWWVPAYNQLRLYLWHLILSPSPHQYWSLNAEPGVPCPLSTSDMLQKQKQKVKIKKQYWLDYFSTLDPELKAEVRAGKLEENMTWNLINETSVSLLTEFMLALSHPQSAHFTAIKTCKNNWHLSNGTTLVACKKTEKLSSFGKYSCSFSHLQLNQ